MFIVTAPGRFKDLEEAGSNISSARVGVTWSRFPGLLASIDLSRFRYIDALDLSEFGRRTSVLSNACPAT